MRETLMCCISCILPCGALDVIRIVHADGRLEEISHAVRAGDVMQANPKHVLRKLPPSSSSSSELLQGGDVRRSAVILPADAELEKGEIYFLMPVSEKTRSRKKKKKAKREQVEGSVDMTTKLLVSGDRYLSEILSERTAEERDGRRGRGAIWRPHLESISEVIGGDV